MKFMNNILVENEVMEFNNESINIDLNVSKVIIDIKNKVVYWQYCLCYNRK